MILELKPITASQVPEIVALDRICIGGLWTAEAYLREIDSPRSSLLALRIADRASRSRPKTIGMACLWAIVDEAHLTLLAVHPSYRGRGLGELLLITMLQDAIARQLKWATLEVNIKNLIALNLYQKHGFQVVGTRKGYYQPAGDDAAILWLKGIQQNKFKSELIGWQQRLYARLERDWEILVRQGTNSQFSINT